MITCPSDSDTVPAARGTLDGKQKASKELFHVRQLQITRLRLSELGEADPKAGVPGLDAPENLSAAATGNPSSLHPCSPLASCCIIQCGKLDEFVDALESDIKHITGSY